MPSMSNVKSARYACCRGQPKMKASALTQTRGKMRLQRKDNSHGGAAVARAREPALELRGQQADELEP
jgi:hypothetical protein